MRSLFLSLFAAAALSLLFLVGSSARALEPVTVTIDSVSSTMTIRGIDVSSAPTTNVIISTVAAYRQICVQNFDTTAFVACSENVSVSSITSNILVGTIVAPAATATQPNAPTCFSIPAGTSFYCRTSSVTGTTRAGITRGR